MNTRETGASRDLLHPAVDQVGPSTGERSPVGDASDDACCFDSDGGGCDHRQAEVRGDGAERDVPAPPWSRPASYVGKRYRCHDPDHPELGEVIEIHAHGCGPEDPLVGRWVTGEHVGAGGILKRQAFLTHYLRV